MQLILYTEQDNANCELVKQQFQQDNIEYIELPLTETSMYLLPDELPLLKIEFDNGDINYVFSPEKIFIWLNNKKFRK